VSTTFAVRSLAMLDILWPAPEIFVLGTGASMQQPPRAAVEHLEARGVSLMALDTVCTQARKQQGRAMPQIEGKG
jgi:uncharacterized protein